MKNLENLTTMELAGKIRQFTNEDKPKRKFNFMKVLLRLKFFLELIIEFLDRTGVGQAQATRKF